MRGLGALAIMLLVGSWSELASAGTFQAFGPENVTRATGKPVPVTKNFTVLNPNTSYTIRINNGGVSGEFAKVSSAVILLNGAQIVSSKEFSQTVTVIEKPITLTNSNALAIELRSKPGSGITVQVIGIDNDPPVITAAVNPPANAAGWHNSDVTVSFDCTDAISGIASCSAPVTVTTEGANQVISGTAIDRAGNSAVASVVVNSDKTSPVVSIAQPADGTRFNTTPVTVTGTVTETLSGISTVTCNGIPALLTGSTFSCGVALTDGSNAIVVQAVDLAGNTGGSTVTVLFSRGPAVRITAPETLALFNSSPITVTGTVADSTASVVVNSVPASVSGGSFSASVPLQEGNNTLTAVATNTFGQVDTASIQVTLDTTPPRVTIDSPADGFVTTSPSITVTGMINDIVVGTVNGEQAQVTVNGIAAQVANRSFLVADVPLSPGPNTLTANGVDQAGNAASTSIIVTFQPVVATPQIQLISGNNQRAPIGSPLPEPLIVALTDATGNPVPGKTVIFKVVENNGTLTNGLNTARSLALTTDAQGRAQVQWTLGTRAGAGNNRVEATAVGFASSAFFTAIAAPSAAAKINIDAGSNQTGVVGEPLPRPLVAVVTDSGHNRLANVPVTFTVLQGGGSFNGQSALTLNTDSDGRALAVLTLGLQEGIENHVVEATFPGNPGLPASFVASGKVAGDPAQTKISGVVLDNTDRPIPGVTLRIEGTALVTQTDAQGQFLLQPAPVGHIQLIADGSTAARPGTWPTLEYELTTISGQNNTIGMPIYLLPLDLPNGLFVDETTGGRLTLPQVPGFSLSVAPGSATFPDGSRSGVVSVTVVHADKIPMTPNFGQQPRFIVTIQPAGVHFDPPAAITIPNLDGLAPGEVTELYSFDHDLGQFVAIGTGTVSEDGTVVRSDPGVGIIKGGWHCGGNPQTIGGAENAHVEIVSPKPVAVAKDSAGALIAAIGGPQPGTFSWTSSNSSVAAIQGSTSGSSVTIAGITPGTATVTTTFTCQSGATATDTVEVNVVEFEIFEVNTPSDTGIPPADNSFLAPTDPIEVKARVVGANSQISWQVLPNNAVTGPAAPSTPANTDIFIFNGRSLQPTTASFTPNEPLGYEVIARVIVNGTTIEDRVPPLSLIRQDTRDIIRQEYEDFRILGNTFLPARSVIDQPLVIDDQDYNDGNYTLMINGILQSLEIELVNEINSILSAQDQQLILPCPCAPQDIQCENANMNQCLIDPLSPVLRAGTIDQATRPANSSFNRDVIVFRSTPVGDDGYCDPASGRFDSVQVVGGFICAGPNRRAETPANTITFTPLTVSDTNITSGYRNPRSNVSAGSRSPNSLHTRGRALDIRTRDFTIARLTSADPKCVMELAGDRTVGARDAFIEDRQGIVPCDDPGADHLHFERP